MEKILQFKLEDFNPDCMTEEELHQWIEFIGNGLRPRVAKQWFPNVKGQFAYTRAIRNYCWNKITAMSCRTRGEIDTAKIYEKICDDIYEKLPQSAKW